MSTTRTLASAIGALAMAVALLLVVAFPAAAGTVGGCEMKPVANSNATQKVDPTCDFNFDSSDDRDGPSFPPVLIDGEWPDLPGLPEAPAA